MPTTRWMLSSLIAAWDLISIGYASFEAGPISFAVAATEDPALVGKHTGIYERP